MIAVRIRNLALAFLIAGLSFQAAAEIVDAIVATVDTEVILQSEIVSEIRPLIADKPEQEIVKLFNEALEQSIEQKILYREGVLNDIKITDEQVEARIKGFRERYASEKDFLGALAEEGVTISAFRERIRKQTVALSMGMSKRRYLEDDAVISEAELSQYYQDNLKQFQKPERVKLYRIFIAMDQSEGGRGKTLARLEALREELALGAEFSKLAEQHSDGPSAAEGGFVGWIGRGDFVADLEDVAFGLEPGDISPIIETDTGMMLFMAAEKVEAGLASFDEVRTEIEPVLRANYGNERYKRWMAELRKRSRVRKYL
ncbi:MAG: peptidylprolyl isomerase [Candidatus Hydrogenedentes bacterium]|nr:peptidylprolyl isomerase [Candidatus Hydrogenedentota bacterium]